MHTLYCIFHLKTSKLGHIKTCMNKKIKYKFNKIGNLLSLLYLVKYYTVRMVEIENILFRTPCVHMKINMFRASMFMILYDILDCELLDGNSFYDYYIKILKFNFEF